MDVNNNTQLAEYNRIDGNANPFNIQYFECVINHKTSYYSNKFSDSTKNMSVIKKMANQRFPQDLSKTKLLPISNVYSAKQIEGASPDDTYFYDFHCPLSDFLSTASFQSAINQASIKPDDYLQKFIIAIGVCHALAIFHGYYSESFQESTQQLNGTEGNPNGVADPLLKTAVRASRSRNEDISIESDFEAIVLRNISSKTVTLLDISSDNKYQVKYIPKLCFYLAGTLRHKAKDQIVKNVQDATCIIVNQINSIEYSAPEILDGSYNEKLDIYQFGILLYQLFTGFRPNQYFDPSKKRVSIDEIGGFRDIQYKSDSESINRFIQKMYEVKDKTLDECGFVKPSFFRQDDFYELGKLVIECMSPKPQMRPTSYNLWQRFAKISSGLYQCFDDPAKKCIKEYIQDITHIVPVYDVTVDFKPKAVQYFHRYLALPEIIRNTLNEDTANNNASLSFVFKLRDILHMLITARNDPDAMFYQARLNELGFYKNPENPNHGITNCDNQKPLTYNYIHSYGYDKPAPKTGDSTGNYMSIQNVAMCNYRYAALKHKDFLEKIHDFDKIFATVGTQYAKALQVGCPEVLFDNVKVRIKQDFDEDERKEIIATLRDLINCTSTDLINCTITDLRDGTIYHTDTNTVEHPAHFRTAVVEPFIPAARVLGNFIEGEDPEEAVQLYSFALENGDAEAYLELARCVKNGIGLPAPSKEQALDLYRTAYLQFGLNSARLEALKLLKSMDARCYKREINDIKDFLMKDLCIPYITKQVTDQYQNFIPVKGIGLDYTNYEYFLNFFGNVLMAEINKDQNQVSKHKIAECINSYISIYRFQKVKMDVFCSFDWQNIDLYMKKLFNVIMCGINADEPYTLYFTAEYILHHLKSSPYSIIDEYYFKFAVEKLCPALPIPSSRDMFNLAYQHLLLRAAKGGNFSAIRHYSDFLISENRFEDAFYWLSTYKSSTECYFATSYLRLLLDQIKSPSNKVCRIIEYEQADAPSTKPTKKKDIPSYNENIDTFFTAKFKGGFYKFFIPWWFFNVKSNNSSLLSETLDKKYYSIVLDMKNPGNPKRSYTYQIYAEKAIEGYVNTIVDYKTKQAGQLDPWPLEEKLLFSFIVGIIIKTKNNDFDGLLTLARLRMTCYHPDARSIYDKLYNLYYKDTEIVCSAGNDAKVLNSLFTLTDSNKAELQAFFSGKDIIPESLKPTVVEKVALNVLPDRELAKMSASLWSEYQIIKTQNPAFSWKEIDENVIKLVGMYSEEVVRPNNYTLQKSLAFEIEKLSKENEMIYEKMKKLTQKIMDQYFAVYQMTYQPLMEQTLTAIELIKQKVPQVNSTLFDEVVFSNNSMQLPIRPNKPSPIYDVQQQDIVQNQPISSVQQPVFSPQQPGSSPQQPVFSPQQPVFSPQQPVFSPQQPVFSPQQPGLSPQQPVVPGQQPFSPAKQTAFQPPNLPICNVFQLSPPNCQPVEQAFQQANAIGQRVCFTPRDQPGSQTPFDPSARFGKLMPPYSPSRPSTPQYTPPKIN